MSLKHRLILPFVNNRHTFYLFQEPVDVAFVLYCCLQQEVDHKESNWKTESETRLDYGDNSHDTVF